MPIKAGYLLLAGAGGVAILSGVKGWSLSKTFRDIVGGTNPKNQKQANPITGAAYPVSGIVGSSGGGTNSAIANSALEYVGFPYTWGGAPANGSGDCSSFVNMIVGWFNGRAIPGYSAGTYSGQVHGPATLQWLVWGGCTTIPLSSAQPGDLAVWQTHMGIIVDNGQHMVSDLNPSLGTLETTISGAAPPGEVLRVRRLNG
jgi:cell wall-associated NlpC family hydrolase